MTLTNNVRSIQDHANLVIKHADHREYELAHCDIDLIEARTRALRRHIDELQLKADCAARPAGEDVT